MRRFAEIATLISSKSSRIEKIGILADYLQELSDADLRAAAIFFTGRPFPQCDARTLNVGGAGLAQLILEISGVTDEALDKAYLAHGDLGDAAKTLLPNRDQSTITPSLVLEFFERLASTNGTSAKQVILKGLLGALTPSEAQYVVKIITGEMRIGLKESTVEEAIAQAFRQPADTIRRLNMALGDIGETAVRTRHGNTVETSFRLFRPVKFMLATPADDEADIYTNFQGSFYVEDKYDGIRGQLHSDGTRVALFSRTLDDVSPQFPEIVDDAQQLTHPIILDGEIVAYQDGMALPFAMLQKRLGRKKPSADLLHDVPMVFMIFDVLHLNDTLLIDEPLETRKKILTQLVWPSRLVLAPFQLIERRIELDPLFEEASRRRNEGLMLKASDSAYVPGKRGKSWMKWKKALATLDVVVTGVELGHGRRRSVLSDYTFAVRKDGELLNIGKAYSGLTDAEIEKMTAFFEEHTIQTFGRFRLVEPLLVLEVTFNGIQRSARHKSGFALRFPRIVRIRQDKTAADIDTLETVEKIYRAGAGETS
jgi:DNA ligase-1